MKNLEINGKKFLKGTCYTLGGVAIIGLIIGGIANSKGTKEEDNNKETTKENDLDTTIASTIEQKNVMKIAEAALLSAQASSANNEEKDDSYSIVENAVIPVKYEDVIKDCANIKEELEKQGIKDISQKSINALYFVVNSNRMSNETVKSLLDNNVIADDSMTVIMDSLEVSNVMMVQNTRAVLNQGDKEIVDATMFCKDTKGIKVLTELTDSLKTIKKADKEEEFKTVYDEFDSFWNHLYDQEGSKISYSNNELHEGVNFLIQQCYQNAFIESGRENGVEGSRLTDVAKSEKVNTYSSIQKQIEGQFYEIFNPEQQLVEKTKTLIK